MQINDLQSVSLKMSQLKTGDADEIRRNSWISGRTDNVDSNGQRPGSSSPSETQEVQQLANRWTEAYNWRNAAALGTLYTDDARLYLHGSPTVSGRRNIQTYWADDMKEKNPITVLAVTHAVNGIDMKLVHGNYQVINRETGVPVGQGRFAHIWARTANGEWRLDRDLWNQPYEQ